MVNLSNRTVTNHTDTTNHLAAFSAEEITLTVDENTASGGNVGSPVPATDSDSDSLTYELTTAFTDFGVDSATGQITVGNAVLNFEGGTTSYEFALFVRDSKGPTGGGDSIYDDSIKVTVNVNDVNEAPILTTINVGDSMPENATNLTVHQFLADDPENDTLTWSLSGVDAGHFEIDSSGLVTLQSAADFENPVDDGMDGVYEVTVNVRDNKINTATNNGNTDSAVDASTPLTLTITNADEAGTVTLPGTFTDGITETAELTDPDGTTTDVTWQWARGETRTFSNFTDISGAESASYTPVAADVGKYLRATASYEDPHFSGKTAWEVSATQVQRGNEDPSFSSPTTTRSVPENSAAGTNVGAAVSTTDSDGDALHYTLSGTNASSFTIDDSNGQIKTKSGVTYDFEVTSSYSVTVHVRDNRDAAGNTDSVNDDSSTCGPPPPTGTTGAAARRPRLR